MLELDRLPFASFFYQKVVEEERNFNYAGMDGDGCFSCGMRLDGG